jgi:hypothetical protein
VQDKIKLGTGKTKLRNTLPLYTPKIRPPYSILQNNSIQENAGIKLFSKLPNTIKRTERLQEFKRRVPYLLMQHVFYSVEEYMSFLDPLLP